MVKALHSVPTCLDLEKSKTESIEVVCFGHFNVLHPGHFRFINFASSKGANLCVVLKSDRQLMDRGFGHYFPEIERATSLINLKQVFEVVTCGDLSLVDCLKTIKPKFLVLGLEFQETEDSEIKEAVRWMKGNGLEVVFHSGGSSSLSPYFDETPFEEIGLIKRKSFLEACSRRNITGDRLLEIVGGFSSAKVVTIGDLIFDNFISCDTLGVSSEAPVLVVKELDSNMYIGGAGIVAAHVASLGGFSHFFSVVGDDELGKQANELLAKKSVAPTLIYDKSRQTTFKTRYLVDTQKIFRVSKLSDHDLSHEIEEKLIAKLDEIGGELDCVIVSDFVYGVVTPRIVEVLKRISKKYGIMLFGDLQCSSQIGSVLKFRDFDMIFPTEKEARIAINEKDAGLESISRQIMRHAKCENLVIKLGGDGLVVYESALYGGNVQSEHFSALSANPIDVSGAGDSLLASTSMALGLGSTAFEACAIGNIVASCAVETLGNLPVNRGQLVAKICNIFGIANK